ncbi:MAG: urease accessory protein UreE [Rhodospirillaceae bacterium]|nr:urease accessory protein UreE [Rhodospirillaceae bacterium]
MAGPLRLHAVAGHAGEPEMAERLHGLSHAGKVEYLTLDRNDTLRKRLRAVSDKGTECAIAIERGQSLDNGAVLFAEDGRAVVVRMKEQAWLRLRPRDAAAGLELGYWVGNLHWRVKFDGDVIAVALDGPESDYLARLEPLLADGRAMRAGDA